MIHLFVGCSFCQGKISHVQSYVAWIVEGCAERDLITGSSMRNRHGLKARLGLTGIG